jgi:hypothetical protein
MHLLLMSDSSLKKGIQRDEQRLTNHAIEEDYLMSSKRNTR